jgi:GR25 family glycosyltransferase involved in LPS biosynthesis
MRTPILFLIFNRPHYTEKVIASIRRVKPAKLYIAADGPRQDKTGEKELCEQTRSLVLNSIDWECEVKTLFQEKNLGCGLGVSTGIFWFFENEEQGIILEDDVVANRSFFKFCEELLEKYKNDKNVWTIGGYNCQGISVLKESYAFTKTFYCWGWATWNDRWKHFSLNVKKLKENILDDYTKNKNIKYHFAEILYRMQSDNPVCYIDSWAYPYQLISISYKVLHILPQKNMVKNIGTFGVHIKDKTPLCNMKTYKLDIASHPKNIKNNYKLQNELDILYRSNPKLFRIPNVKNRKVYLWGTGAFAWWGLFLARKYKIAGFLDRQQIQEYYGYKVWQPEQILRRKNKDFFIFIASTKYAKEMAQTCVDYGLKKGVNFWSPN